MKRKRITALLLALALCISLTACGGGDNSASAAGNADNAESAENTAITGNASAAGNADNTAKAAIAGSSSYSAGSYQPLIEELGFGYLSEYRSLTLDADYINRTGTADGKLYVLAERYENDATHYMLWEINPDDGSTAELPLPQLTNTETSTESIMHFVMDPDASGYWILIAHYNSSSLYDDVVLYNDEAPPIEVAEAENAVAAEAENAVAAEAENAEAAEVSPAVEPDEYTELTDSSERFSLLHCDRSGNITQTIDLNSSDVGGEYFYPNAMASDNQGTIYIATDRMLLQCSTDGTITQLSLETSYINSLAASADGHVVVHYYTPDDWTDAYAPIENGALGTPFALDSSISGGALMPGSGSTLLLRNNAQLYRLDAADGSVTPLLNWLDSDISGSQVNTVAAPDDDTLLVLLQDYSRDGMNYELGVLTKTPADQLPVRTVLTLGTVYADQNLEKQIVRFNRNSDTYRISIRDYCSYNTAEDYTLAASQLQQDLISGTGPDLISLNDVKADALISKGALTDLSGYINSDPELAGDGLMAGPMQAYSADGKIYGVPQSFYLQTLLGSARLLGDRGGWTTEEMAQVIAGLDSETTIMEYMTSTDFLGLLLTERMADYVNYADASCSFDSDEFRSLLQLCAALPVEISYDDAFVYRDTFQSLQEGTTLLCQVFCSSSYELRVMTNLYTYDNGFVKIGYPDGSGNGTALSVNGGLAISSSCTDPDGAWSFIRSVLTEEAQADLTNGYPVLTAAFDAVADAAAKPDTYLDENGETVTVDPTYYIGETEYTIALPTQEQLQGFKDYINASSVCGSYDSNIMEIISEEAAAFFSGDKSAQEVSSLIQNRVSSYLGETN